MITLKQRLQFIMEGGMVVRYHTRPGVRPNSDAQHSHGVAMFCLLIAGDDVRAALLKAALTHDLGEQGPGDVSSPAKRKFPTMATQLEAFENTLLERYGLAFQKDLTLEERSILKFADILDGLQYCLQELALGNRMMEICWRRYSAYLLQLVRENQNTNYGQCVYEIYRAMQEIYKEIRSEDGPGFDVFISE